MKKLSIVRILLAVLSLSLAATAVAETKVLERSVKKAPAWVGTAEDGYLIVNVRAATLAAAQEEALQKITEQIVKTVASNVSVQQHNVMNETVNNGRIESNDSFTKSTAIIAANMPYLKGITLAKAADVYWERKMDKKTKQEFYDYAVKYPFPPSERRKLIYEYEELDKSKEAELDALEQELPDAMSTDAITQAVARLDALEEFFVDNVRLAKIKTLRKRYNDLYKDVTVYGTFTAKGELVCGLELHGYRFDVPSMGRVDSNCARILSTGKCDERQFKITFNSDDCLDDEVNTITVNFKVGGRNLAHSFTIPAAAQSDIPSSFDIVATGTVHLTAESSDTQARTVSNIDVRLSLDNKSGLKFGLKGIELRVPDLSTPIVLDNLDLVYTTKGVVQARAQAQGTFRVAERRKSTASFATGTATVVNPLTGAVERLRFTLPYTTNWNK